MSIVDPLKFLFALALFSIGLQVFGCAPGFINNYGEPRETYEEKILIWEPPEWCKKLSNSTAEYHSKTKSISRQCTPIYETKTRIK